MGGSFTRDRPDAVLAAATVEPEPVRADVSSHIALPYRPHNPI